MNYAKEKAEPKSIAVWELGNWNPNELIQYFKENLDAIPDALSSFDNVIC